MEIVKIFDDHEMERRAMLFLAILDNCDGVVLDAIAAMEGDDRWTYNEHSLMYESSTGYKAAVDRVQGKLLDLAEKAIAENVRKGEQRAAEFLLENKGKNRGYGKGVSPINARTITLNIFEGENNNPRLE